MNIFSPKVFIFVAIATGIVNGSMVKGTFLNNHNSLCSCIEKADHSYQKPKLRGARFRLHNARCHSEILSAHRGTYTFFNRISFR